MESSAGGSLVLEGSSVGSVLAHEPDASVRQMVSGSLQLSCSLQVGDRAAVISFYAMQSFDKVLLLLSVSASCLTTVQTAKKLMLTLYCFSQVFKAAGKSPASNIVLLEQMLMARSETAGLVGCDSYSSYKAWGARCV